MTATWASSAYSAGTTQIAEQYHVSTQVATLGTALFLFGFGIGPLLWAPLSEVYGRRFAVFVPMSIAICFSFGTATAKDFQTIMITRFFGAFFASAPVTNTGGVLGDLFSPAERGIAMAGYAMAVVSGPVIGPILGAIPIIFGEIRGWNAFVSTLPFLCILVGAILGAGANVYNQMLYNKAYHAAGDRAVPEKRLPPMMVGSVLFSGGQFLIGWTAQPEIHWIVPCIGLLLLGTGFFTIFQAALNYLLQITGFTNSLDGRAA
ncbi:hypothetical protein G7Z17_g1760 [Cylindrodendrum hubeiense]|uniref:Major facilitator superfamily (MFS) profile domain-containing protein n=1 Tax=Cylindrodendrum hubeiense TaxID=595255 RepID=A0A9P5LCA6_9HYPO|nr:hypothetical protein G7Z17_g1760 [Cylindrodendrum hubeiense]